MLTYTLPAARISSGRSWPSISSATTRPSTPSASRSSSPGSSSTTRCATSAASAPREGARWKVTGRPTAPSSARSTPATGSPSAARSSGAPRPSTCRNRRFRIGAPTTPWPSPRRWCRSVCSAPAGSTPGPGAAAATRSMPVAPPTRPTAAPRSHRPARRLPAVRLVPDEELGRLATTEFVPPKGIEPWQGAVLLREQIDDDTVSAWFSGQAARDVITISKDGDDDVVLAAGPRFADASPADAAILRPLFDGAPSITLDGYDKDFATAWRSVRAEVERSIAASGFWKRLPPSAGGCSARLSLPLVIVAGAWLFIGAGSLATALLGWFSGPVGALAFGLVVPALGGVRDVPVAAPGTQCRRQRAGPAHRVVPAVPRRERGSARGVGVDAWPAPRVLGVGGRPRRGLDVGAGDGGDRASRRPSCPPGRCSSTAWVRRSPAAAPRRARAAPAGSPAAGSPAAASAAAAAAAAPDPGSRDGPTRLLRFAATTRRWGLEWLDCTTRRRTPIWS